VLIRLPDAAVLVQPRLPLGLWSAARRALDRQLIDFALDQPSPIARGTGAGWPTLGLWSGL